MTDIEALIGQMTLKEKAALCTGASAWTTTPVERLGIPAMLVSDGPHGVRRGPDESDPRVTEGKQVVGGQLAARQVVDHDGANPGEAMFENDPVGGSR